MVSGQITHSVLYLGPMGSFLGSQEIQVSVPCTPFLILDTAVCQQCIVALFSTCGSWVPPVSLKDSSLRGDGGSRMPTSLRWDHRNQALSFPTQQPPSTQIHTQHTYMCMHTHAHVHTPWQSSLVTGYSHRAWNGSQMCSWSSLMGTPSWRILSNKSWS